MIKRFLPKVEKGFLIAVAIFLPSIAWAGTASGGAIPNPLPGITSVEGLIIKILQIVMEIGVPLAALAIIYSGFLFVTAGGDEKKVTDAKNAFYAAVIGAGIILGAFVIVTALKNTVTSLGT